MSLDPGDLEAAERLLAYVTKATATPPEYVAEVGKLSDLLALAFEKVVGPLAAQAADDLAALTGSADAKRRKARRRILALEREVAAAGPAGAESLAGDVGKALVAMFRLGQAEVVEPLGWKAGFDVADYDALAGLRDSGLWWIGEHYGDAVPTTEILDVVEETILRGGFGADEAGKILRARIGALFPEKNDAYWRMFAGTAATRSRSFGAVSGLVATGGVTYEYMNPLDERTSEVCRDLDGTEFTVSGAVDLRDRLRSATTPEEWKTISPWPRPKDLRDAGGAILPASELQARGIAWPPLHGYCRSSIAAKTWGPITEAELDAAGALPGAMGLRPPKAA